ERDVAEGEQLLGTRLGLAVQDGGANDHRLGMHVADDALGGGLRLALGNRRAWLVLLGVAGGRLALAVEDEVGGDVHEPRAKPMGYLGDVARAFHNRSTALGVGLSVRGVDDRRGRVPQERPMYLLLVANVERDRLSVRRLALELARDDRPAELPGLARDLRAEVARGARDEELHATVTARDDVTTAGPAVLVQRVDRRGR